jgi:hypothetical protein
MKELEEILRENRINPRRGRLCKKLEKEKKEEKKTSKEKPK